MNKKKSITIIFILIAISLLIMLMYKNLSYYSTYPPLFSRRVDYLEDIPDDFYFSYSDRRGGGIPCTFSYEISKKDGLLLSSCFMNSYQKAIPHKVSDKNLNKIYDLLVESELLNSTIIPRPNNYWDWTMHCEDCGGPAYQPHVKLIMNGHEREISFGYYNWDPFQETFQEIERIVRSETNGKDTYTSIMRLEVDSCKHFLASLSNLEEEYSQDDIPNKSLEEFVKDEFSIDIEAIPPNLNHITNECFKYYQDFSVYPEDVAALKKLGFQ